VAAGADLGAADPLQTGARDGDLAVGNGDGVTNVTVRSGTGAIELAASRDVVLRNALGQQGNVIYTAGVADVVVPAFASGQTPQFTEHGGDVRIVAGRDVLGTDGAANQVGSTQTINEWLFRGGRATAAAPAVWWINFASFNQGVGALGGGDLSIDAGRDIVRLGAVVPSNGFASGGDVSQRNAGSLRVTAGRAIEQGLIYDEAGLAEVEAGAIVGNAAVSNPQLAVLRLAQGSNRLDLQARESAVIGSPFNPTAYAAALANYTPGRPTNYSTYFFTYGAASRFGVRAAAGDIDVSLPAFGPAATTLPSGSTFGGAVYQFADILAPSVSIVSFGGSVRLPAAGSNGSGTFGSTGDIYAYRLFPSATGQLELLADGDIDYAKFAMSQADPTALASPLAPKDFATQTEPLLFSQPLASATPLHTGDPLRAEVVARDGSIIAPVLYIPKAVEIAAGGDIRGDAVTFSGVGIKIQNVDDGSFTSISAGGRIDFTLSNRVSLSISGPGAAEVVAGGALDLGTSGSGIVSNGNLDNNALAPNGANLIVVAGAGRGADGFAQRPDYSNALQEFVRFDAFAAAGSDANGLNQQAIAALKKDPAYRAGSAYGALVDGLQAALANRAAIDDPASPLVQLIRETPAASLANAGVKLAAAVQAVANKRFVQSGNTDTFAPGYAVFGDLFPGLSNDANAIRSFVQDNPFAKASNAEALRTQVLGAITPALASVIELGLAAPASVNDPTSAFSRALAALDPTLLHQAARGLLNSTLSVAGVELDALRTAHRVDSGEGSPFAQQLTAFADSFASSAARGSNDLSMIYSQIKTEQSGNVAIFTPQGGVRVGQAAAPVGVIPKVPSDLGIFTLGGGDIIGMARDDFDVFRSRVFTVAGGDITLWSSQANIDAGRGPRDIAVAPAPRLITDPNGITKLDIGGAVEGSGIGALRTRSDQPPSDIALIAPLGFIDAGEAGIRAETGSVTLGTNLVINAGNIQAASGVSGGAVVTAPPVPVPAAANTSAADRAAEEVTRAATAQQQDAEERARKERRKRVTGEFLGFGRD